MRPGPRDALQAGLAVALLPACVLAVLSAAGAITPLAALGAAVCVLAGSTVLAQVFLRDLFRLTQGPEAPVPALWPWTALAQALSARRHAELAQATSQDRAQSFTDRAILDALPDPLLVLAEDRSLRYANQAARDTLGNEMSAVLRHPTLRAAIDRVQAAERTMDTVDLLLPVPIPRDLQATVIDLGPAAPQARIALLFADRTRARAVERMRADFVANASHELRTPLASLIGFIDTLRGPAADDAPAQKRFLDIMADQAQRMNRLIDDLLSLSRVELTEHLAPAGRVDLATLLGRTLSSFEPRCTQAGAQIRQDVQQGLPPVLADADQIEQVLQNLLDNALKYGRPGGTIEVTLKEATGGRWPSRAGVILCVKDEGQGIPRVHLPRLTERFYRVDRGRSRSAGGTGLGLAIVKHIVNRHRGQLSIESEESVGSTFSVWLPLAA
jgi:two-component system phosphate regulon sensor histidine kinase PhoR